MALQLHGREDLKFDFWHEAFRDEVIEKIRQVCNQAPLLDEPIQSSPPTSPLTSTTPSPSTSPPPSESRASQPASRPADILAPARDLLLQTQAFSDQTLAYMPFIANKPWITTAKLQPRTFVCLTIGSRGDVQPYIALGLRLKQDGHKVVIVTHGSSTGKRSHLAHRQTNSRSGLRDMGLSIDKLAGTLLR